MKRGRGALKTRYTQGIRVKPRRKHHGLAARDATLDPALPWSRSNVEAIINKRRTNQVHPRTPSGRVHGGKQYSKSSYTPSAPCNTSAGVV